MTSKYTELSGDGEFLTVTPYGMLTDILIYGKASFYLIPKMLLGSNVNEFHQGSVVYLGGYVLENMIFIKWFFINLILKNTSDFMDIMMILNSNKTLEI